jgi:hypothetical protein
MKEFNAASRLVTASDDKTEEIKMLCANYFGPKHVAGADAHGSSVMVYLKKGVNSDDLSWLWHRANCKSSLGVEVRPSPHSGTIAILIDASRFEPEPHYQGRKGFAD